MPVLDVFAALPAVHAAGTLSLLDPASLLAGLGPSALGFGCDSMSFRNWLNCPWYLWFENSFRK